MSNDTKLIKQVLYNLQKLNEKKKKLSKKQLKIAKAAPPPDEITGADFKALQNKKKKNETLEDVLESFIQLQENPQQYEAPPGSKRAKELQMSKDDLASGDPERIARGRRRRDRMEKKERDKAAKQKKNESLSVSRYQLNELISEAVEAEKLAIMLEKIEELEEKKKRKKKKKKKKKKGGGLSAAVKKSLDKKADKRGFTRGSVYSEFRKGLAAYYSSGSRKGMSAHQWAHARVNSANPSKSWATVKKRKGGKKKKKK